MGNTRLELVVGAFVLVGIVCLGYLSIKLGKLEVIGGDLYEVDAQFTTASGLKPGATVEIACLYTICNTEFLGFDPLRRITY